MTADRSAEKSASKSARKGTPPRIARRTPPPPPPPPSEAESARAFAFSVAERMKQARKDHDENALVEEGIRLSRRPTTRTKGEKTQCFPAADLKQFRKTLLAMRDSIVNRSGELKKVALEQTDDRGGEDDDGSDSFVRLQSLGQVDQQNRVVARIDDALRRIDDGTYGVCELCGQLIRKPRLVNMPFVHTCMECQNEIEKNPKPR